MRAITRADLPEGATLVETPPYLLTHRLLGEVIRRPGILTVSGEPGCGKTFAVDDYFGQHPCDVVKLHIPGTDRGYGFLRRLVAELGGIPKGDDDDLLDELERVIADRRVVVYVDEAHRLSQDSLRQICWIHDHLPRQVTYVLVGSNFQLAYRRVPELWSRVTRRTNFDPLVGAELVACLRAYHAFYRAADETLLLRIDAEHCRGNWRVWADVLGALQNGARKLGTDGLTEEVARAVLGTVVDVQRDRPKKRGTKAIRGKRPKAKAA